MSSAERPADASAPHPAAAADLSNATAQAAAEEECHRAVVDLQEVARKLDKHQFQDKAKLWKTPTTKLCLLQRLSVGHIVFLGARL